jgi:hypothetical protein
LRAGVFSSFWALSLACLQPGPGGNRFATLRTFPVSKRCSLSWNHGWRARCAVVAKAPALWLGHVSIKPLRVDLGAVGHMVRCVSAFVDDRLLSRILGLGRNWICGSSFDICCPTFSNGTHVYSGVQVDRWPRARDQKIGNSWFPGGWPFDQSTRRDASFAAWVSGHCNDPFPPRAGGDANFMPYLGSLLTTTCGSSGGLLAIFCSCAVQSFTCVPVAH